jgi:hypothetical protein
VLPDACRKRGSSMGMKRNRPQCVLLLSVCCVTGCGDDPGAPTVPPALGERIEVSGSASDLPAQQGENGSRAAHRATLED